jgi:hypothetical protein
MGKIIWYRPSFVFLWVSCFGLSFRKHFFGIIGLLVFPLILGNMILIEFWRRAQGTSRDAAQGVSSAADRPLQKATTASFSLSSPWWTNLRGSAATAAAGGADTVVYVAELSPNPNFLHRLFRFPYPDPFSAVSIPVAFGENKVILSCQVARHRQQDSSKTIILVPAMFNASSMAINGIGT